MPIVIEPRAIVEAGALHNQRVAIPSSDRVAHPRWIRSRFQRSSVEKDLAVGEVGVEDDDQSGRLDDLHHLGACAVRGRRVARPERHAAHVHVFLTEIFSALLDERACPRLNLLSFQIGGDVARVLR